MVLGYDVPKGSPHVSHQQRRPAVSVCRGTQLQPTATPLTGNVVPQLCLPPEPGKQVPRASGTLALRGGRACPTSITLF